MAGSSFAFNFNSHVRVKLTDVGRNMLREHGEAWRAQLPEAARRSLGEYQLPKTDSQGYTQFQLHEFMLQFGAINFAWLSPEQLPFESTLYFDEDEFDGKIQRPE